MNIVYYATLIIITSFIGPLLSVSQGTFAAEMSHNSVQRTHLTGFNQIASAIASVISSMILLKLFTAFGQNNPRMFFIAAIIYDLIALISLVFFYLSVYERPVDESTIQSIREKPSLKKGFVGVVNNFISTIKIKSYRIYLGMYLSEQMFRTLAETINTYFIVFVLFLNPKSVTVSVSIGMFLTILFTTFFMWLTAKTSGSFTYRIGGVVTILVLLCFMRLGIIRATNTYILLMILTNILYLGKAGLVNSAQFFFTFMPDVDEMVTGKRREGAYAGVSSFLDVFFTTIETILVGIVLQVSGFVKSAKVQPPTTRSALLILYTVVPIILVTIGMILSYRLKLNVKTHKILEGEVNRLKNGGLKEEATEETRTLIEDLTGFSYEKCWGNNDLIEYETKARISKTM